MLRICQNIAHKLMLQRDLVESMGCRKIVLIRFGEKLLFKG